MKLQLTKLVFIHLNTNASKYSFCNNISLLLWHLQHISHYAPHFPSQTSFQIMTLSALYLFISFVVHIFLVKLVFKLRLFKSFFTLKNFEERDMNHFTNVSRLVKSIEKQRMTLLNTHLPQRISNFV